MLAHTSQQTPGPHSGYLRLLLCSRTLDGTLVLLCNQEVIQSRSQSSQATVLELWAFPDLQGPPGTQLNTSWSHLKTPQDTEND